MTALRTLALLQEAQEIPEFPELSPLAIVIICAIIIFYIVAAGRCSRKQGSPVGRRSSRS